MNKTIKKRLANPESTIGIPMKWVGPLQFRGSVLSDQVSVPLATFETPLWPSVSRGMKVVNHAGGVFVAVDQESMTRSFALEATSLEQAMISQELIQKSFLKFEEIISTSSRYAKLLRIDTEIIGKIIYIRVVINSADASGHNMATKSAEGILNYILTQDASLKYLTLSANYCSDKKVSAVNGILGRGRSCLAEVTIDRDLCRKFLRTNPEAICELNTKKNLLGSILAGSLRSANAHYANILLATYLATGQDAANIVEGSQGITFADIHKDQLVFSVKIPNIIVGTVGNGKGLSFVLENLSKLGCLKSHSNGENSRRLAGIIAGAVLCGELSLLAALTNPGELMKSHLTLER